MKHWYTYRIVRQLVSLKMMSECDVLHAINIYLCFSYSAYIWITSFHVYVSDEKKKHEKQLYWSQPMPRLIPLQPGARAAFLEEP